MPDARSGAARWAGTAHRTGDLACSLDVTVILQRLSSSRASQGTCRA